MSGRSPRYPPRSGRSPAEGIRLMPPRFVELSKKDEQEVVDLLADILIDAIRRQGEGRAEGQDDEETDDSQAEADG